MAPPQAFDLEAFQRQLQTQAVGRELLYFESVPSTMDVAREQAAAGAAHGTLVLAEEQTAGRGRRGRSFYSPPSENLYFTLVLRLQLAVHRRLPVLLPLAVARAIRAQGVEASIKWPNDIWLGQRKVCGMLIDAELAANGGLAFPGIGINVNGDPEHNPELAGVATSIARVAGHDVSRETLLAELCNELEGLLTTPIDQAISEYRALSLVLGRDVTVVPTGGTPFEARAIAISDDGELMVRRSGGLVTAINAADVSVRPLKAVGEAVATPEPGR